MVSRNFLKNLVVKNLIECPLPKYISLVSIKQMHLAAKMVVLGVLVMAVGECGRDEKAVRRH